jgi:ferredoxin
MSGSQSTVGKTRLRVIADRSACCGYGVCAELCPEVFKLDDLGIVTLLTEFAPAGLEAKTSEAASACPQNALKVAEEPAEG